MVRALTRIFGMKQQCSIVPNFNECKQRAECNATGTIFKVCSMRCVWKETMQEERRRDLKHARLFDVPFFTALADTHAPAVTAAAAAAARRVALGRGIVVGWFGGPGGTFVRVGVQRVRVVSEAGGKGGDNPGERR
eukprot:688567-Hanusia_phi.AAC.1